MRDSQENVIPLDEAYLSQYQFGARAAEQMAAFAEDDSAGRNTKGQTQDDLKRRRAARASDYHQKLATMDFEERVQATIECVTRRNTFRDILLGLIRFCEQERTYEEIEPFVESFVEFERNRQSQRRYVHLLLRTGALVETELDEVGAPLTNETKQAAIHAGLDPEDVDTLVFGWRVATTEVGQKAWEELDPGRRIQALMDSEPELKEALIEIMAFCDKPRYSGEVIDMFWGKPSMGFDKKTKQMRQPNSFIDKLERAGAMVWDNEKWVLTEAGRVYLARRVNK